MLFVKSFPEARLPNGEHNNDLVSGRYSYCLSKSAFDIGNENAANACQQTGRAVCKMEDNSQSR